MRALLNSWSVITQSLHEALNQLHRHTTPKFISLILTFLFITQFPLMAMADHTNEPVIPVSDEDFLYYHHDDHLGSSHVLTEGKDKGYHSGVTYNKGDLLQRFEYEPFGREKYVLNPNLNIDPSYTGQTYDVESGLYYYHARYYDPTLARFIQPDTIVPDAKNLQEFNRYGYVTNNPLKYTDPTGHFRIGGESFSGGPLRGFGEGFTGGFAGGGSGILQAFGSGLSLIFDMFQQNSWNEEVVADGSGDSQYYYEYEGGDDPGGILGGVVQSTPGFWDDDKYDFSGFDGEPLDIRIGEILLASDRIHQSIMSGDFGSGGIVNLGKKGAVTLASKILGKIGLDDLVHVSPVRNKDSILAKGLDPGSYVTKWKYLKDITNPKVFNTKLYNQGLWQKRAHYFDSGADIFRVNKSGAIYRGPRTNMVDGVPQWEYIDLVKPNFIKHMGGF